MKTFKYTIMFGLALAISLSAALAGDDVAWMDMENCAMCKNMSAEEGLMENMSFEHHLTAMGMMSMCVVKPGFEEKYAKAAAGMMETQKMMMAGEKVDLCGLCISMGSLMQSGAKVEQIETKGGHVMLMSSSDEAMIAKIHAHGQKTIDYMAKMAEKMKSGAEVDPHAGHNH
jgi:hypothetical protein